MGGLDEVENYVCSSLGWRGAHVRKLGGKSVAEALAVAHLGRARQAGLLGMHLASVTSKKYFETRLDDLEDMGAEEVEAVASKADGANGSLCSLLKSALGPQEAGKYGAAHVIKWIISWRSSEPFKPAEKDQAVALALHPSKQLFAYVCCEAFEIRCHIMRGESLMAFGPETCSREQQLAIVVKGNDEYVALPEDQGEEDAATVPMDMSIDEEGADQARCVFASLGANNTLLTAQSYELVLKAPFEGPPRTLLGTVLIQTTKPSKSDKTSTKYTEPMLPAPDTAFVYVNVHHDTLRMVVHVHERSGLRIESVLRSRSRELTDFAQREHPPEFYIAVKDELLTAIVGPISIGSTTDWRHTFTLRELTLHSECSDQLKIAHQLIATDQYLKQSPEKSCWSNAGYGQCFYNVIRGVCLGARFELWDAITQRPIYSQARANREVMLIFWRSGTGQIKVKVNDTEAMVVKFGIRGVGVHRFAFQEQGIAKIHVTGTDGQTTSLSFPVIEPEEHKTAVLVAPLYLHLEKRECAEHSLRPRPLEGTVEDILHMENVLVHGQGFSTVRRLAGVDATKANILNALWESVEAATAVKERSASFLDVAVYLHFSGHGHWWKTGKPSNSEGFVCTDTAVLKENGDVNSEEDWLTFPGLTEKRSCLTHVDLRQLIELANRKKIALSFCFDSCYSRSLIKRRGGAALRLRPRTVSDKIPIRVHERRQCDPRNTHRTSNEAGRDIPGQMDQGDEAWVYISSLAACNRDQEASELQHPLHTDKSMGLLTSAMEIVFYDALVQHVKSKMSGKVPDADVLSWRDLIDRCRGLLSPIVNGDARPPAGADALLPTPFATFNSSLQVFSSIKSHAAGHLRWRPAVSLRASITGEGQPGTTFVLELDQGSCELVVPGTYQLYRILEEHNVFHITVKEEHIHAHKCLIPLTHRRQYQALKSLAPGSVFAKLLKPEHETGSQVVICVPEGVAVKDAAAALKKSLDIACSGSWWSATVVPIYDDSNLRQLMSSDKTLLVITPHAVSAGDFQWKAARQVRRPAQSKRSGGTYDVSSFAWEETLPPLPVEKHLEMAKNVRRLLAFVGANLHADFFSRRVRVGKRHPFRVHFKYYRRQGSRGGPGRGINANYIDLAIFDEAEFTLPSTAFVVDTSVTRADTKSGPNIHTGDRVAFTIDRAVTGNPVVDGRNYNVRVLWMGSDGAITQIHPLCQGSLDVIEPFTVSAGERVQRGPFVVYHNPGVYHLPQARGHGMEYICFYFTASGSRGPRAFLQDGVYLEPKLDESDAIKDGSAQFNPYAIDDSYDQFVFQVPFLTAPPCVQKP